MPKVAMTVNGKRVSGEVEGRTLLVQFLREHLGLTGTHVGCDTTQCGCCTVHVDGTAMKSCTVLALSCEGSAVTTIEGLALEGTLHPMQQAFHEYHGLQCGFCTPGMIMTAYGLLLKNPKMTRAQIIEGMDQNLCRCAAHKRIVQAIESVCKK